MTYRDEPGVMKSLEQIEKKCDRLDDLMNTTLDRIAEFKEDKSRLGVLATWANTIKHKAASNDAFALLYHGVWWVIMVTGMVFLVVIGGRAGCAYEQHTASIQRYHDDEEFCDRVCTGVAAEYIGRNGDVQALSGTGYDQQLSHACLCARDTLIFPVDDATGMEIHYISQPHIQVPMQMPAPVQQQ